MNNEINENQKQRGLFFNPQGYMGKYLQKGRLNIGFIDGSWGSSGKGKFNALLAWDPELDFAVSHNSVNASHIVVWDDGREYKFQHLPTSVVNPRVKIVMGAGASIELPQLLKEIKDWSLDHTVPGYNAAYEGQRLFIHPNAVVITQDDVDYEKEHLVRIASTMTGNGAAAGRKVMRPRAPGRPVIVRNSSSTFATRRA
jgi:adenylosuccinate synthase